MMEPIAALAGKWEGEWNLVSITDSQHRDPVTKLLVASRVTRTSAAMAAISITLLAVQCAASFRASSSMHMNIFGGRKADLWSIHVSCL